MASDRWLVACLVVLVALFCVPGSVFAAQQAAPGIGISPFLQQLTLDQHVDQKTFTLTVSNHTTAIQEINLSTKDFGSLNDTGGILLGGSDTYSQKYGLASWMELEKDSVVLNPGDSATALVTIKNRLDLQPGGHYGAIVASVNSAREPGNDKVLVTQQLLSLVLVDKVGGEHFDLKLDGFEDNGNWLHLPNKVRLHFKNPGNVHVVPRGVVRLKSPSGTVVAQGIINSESAYVLPESFRQLYVPLSPVGKTLPVPGLYHIEVEYRYDGLDKSAVQSRAISFINLGLYVLGFAVLLLVFVIAKKRHKKNKKAIHKTSD